MDLECRPELVAAARDFVRVTLRDWELGQLADDAALVCSELVANAILHARTAIRLNVATEGLSNVRIEVYDDNSRMPSLAACPDDATSGRGLNLIAALAGTWGTEHR